MPVEENKTKTDELNASGTAQEVSSSDAEAFREENVLESGAEDVVPAPEAPAESVPSAPDPVVEPGPVSYLYLLNSVLISSHYG